MSKCGLTCTLNRHGSGLYCRDRNHQREGAVLYCYPSTTSEDRQLKQVGLCEAIIKFSENFSTKPCESLHTQKARYIFFQPEPGYWFILILTVPSVVKSSQEGIQVTDYKNDDIQDNVFQSCLTRFYQRFILLNGKLEEMIDNKGLQDLRDALRKHLDKSLSKWDPNRAGINDIFFGLKLLPLQRQMFLRVQCFVNNLLITWGSVKHVLVLQGSKLIWSGVNQRDVQVLYDFVVREGIPPDFLEGGKHEKFNGIVLTCFSFLTMPEVTGYNSDTENGHRKHCNMLVYKEKQTYVVMLVYADKSDFMREFCNKIEDYMKQNLVQLAKDLVDETKHSNEHSGGLQRIMSSGPFGLGSGIPAMPTSLIENTANNNVKYVYFNYLNLEEKVSPNCFQGQLEAYKLLADLKDDLSKNDDHGEVVAKMESDTWIVAKVSNRREYYGMWSNKNANILEIDEEMRKLTDVHLKHIYFQD
ncbi:unnamed protein product [Allacma fusca]|uniref:Vacuolar fusion protein CCZ1 homolog n=1 Tax=Allacma fusca TaxID=39272 RepID=A0A8J2P6Y5_9HEXA|nr:unnamed protein product [Allacma fusca]